MSSLPREANNPDYLSSARLAGRVDPAPGGEVRLRLSPAELSEAMRELRAAGGRFITLFMAETPELALTALVALRGELVLLQAHAHGDDEMIPYEQLGGWWPAVADHARPGPDRSRRERSRRVHDPLRPGALRCI
jgi:hypothetical protein